MACKASVVPDLGELGLHFIFAGGNHAVVSGQFLDLQEIHRAQCPGFTPGLEEVGCRFLSSHGHVGLGLITALLHVRRKKGMALSLKFLSKVSPAKVVKAARWPCWIVRRAQWMSCTRRWVARGQSLHR